MIDFSVMTSNEIALIQNSLRQSKAKLIRTYAAMLEVTPELQNGMKPLLDLSHQFDDALRRRQPSGKELDK